MLSFLKNQIISLALGYLAGLAQKIPHVALRAYVQYLIVEVSFVVGIVTDSNPNNKIQFAALWEDHKVEFIHNTSETTLSIADKVVKDTKVKYVTMNLIKDLEYVLTTGEILEGSQLESYYKTIDFSTPRILKSGGLDSDQIL